MYCNDKKLLFIHIPKTGGYTIKKILEPYSNDTLYQTTNTFSDKGLGLNCQFNGPDSMHTTLAEYNEIFKKINIDLLDSGIRSFCIVRNPWDRILSYYMWLHQGKFESMKKFEDFVSLKSDNKLLNLTDFQQYKCGDIKGKFRIDNVLKYENFVEELKTLFDEYDIDYKNNLDTKLNTVNRDRHYSEFYTERAKDYIHLHCNKEIELFNYEFLEE